MAQPNSAPASGRISTRTAFRADLPRLPGDLWGVVVSLVPPAYLGCVACASKSLNTIVNNPNHWQQRLLRLGLLATFEQHASQRHFTDVATGVLNWREYYISFYLLEQYPFRQTPLFSPTELCDESALEFQRIDEPAIPLQFPPYCTGKAVRARASKPWYPNWASRRENDGKEEGIFWNEGDKTYAYHWEERRDPSSYEYHDISGQNFQANSFRLLKTLLLLNAPSKYNTKLGDFCYTCPFPISYLDWAHCLLTALDISLSRSHPHAQQFSNHLTRSRALLALRHRRKISVVFGTRTVNLVVRSWKTKPLLVEISKAFANELAGHYPLQLLNIKSQKDPKKMLGRYTDGVCDGDVWIVEAFRLPKPPREPQHKPPSGKANGGGGQKQAGNRTPQSSKGGK